MILCVFILFLTLALSPVYAASFEVSGQPDSINAASPFEVSYTFTCSACDKKVNYFAGVFKAVDSDYHFGFTEVKDEWLNYETETDPTHFAEASPSAEGVWSGKLTLKAIDLSALSTRFKGQGSYLLRIIRFTPNTTSNRAEVPIILNYTPPPTPTPQPTPKPTPMPTTEPTPTVTPIPTALPSATPVATAEVKKSTPRPSIQASPTFTLATVTPIATVAGIINTNSPTPQFVPYIFVAGGILLVGGALPIGLKFLTEKST